VKKYIFIFVLFGLAASIYAQKLPLKDVIERSARSIEGSLQEKNKAAVVNFKAPSEEFSVYAIEELIGELVRGQKIVVVDRGNLELIRNEINYQYSGNVSDESMMSVGKQLGAQFIISGSLINMGNYYRFMVKVINVETTEIKAQVSFNLKNDSQVASLITVEGYASNTSGFYGRQRFAMGAGMEVNMNSKEDVAMAYGAKAGMDFSIIPALSVGLNAGFSFSEMNVIEPAAMLRWYFMHKYAPIFIQADAGVWMGIEQGKDMDIKFLGGASAGVRIPMARNFYVEPYARVGYPFMFGGGVMAGLRLPIIKANDPVGGMTPKTQAKSSQKASDTNTGKETSFAEQVAAIVQEFKDDHIWVEFDSDGRLRLMVSVVFGANSTEFDNLSPEIMASNERTLRYVADILKRAKYSSIIVEGHSNPTTPEGAARNREENELKLLSRLRALTVVDELRQHGVNLDRRNVQGVGSSRLVAPYNDPQNNWKNRRVEFILIQ